ncbi:MAG: TIGR03936 family radical SAM-associated protein [Anaerolineae bacterium]
MSELTPPSPHETRPALRHRITFATRRTLAYVSVLNLGTIWERTLRRARVPVKYSQGYNPHPRLQFARPLPTGCGGEAEWLDVYLDEAWTAVQVEVALRGKTPRDLQVKDVAPVPDDEPALQQQVVATTYQTLLRGVDPEVVRERITVLLAAETLMRPKRGRRRNKMYDLRPLVQALQLAEPPAGWDVALRMELTALPGATGRPDEVLKALELADAPRRCTRLHIHLK